MISKENETKIQHLSLQIQHLRAMDMVIGRNASLPLEEVDVWADFERTQKRNQQFRLVGEQALKAFPDVIKSYMKTTNLTHLFIGKTASRINFIPPSAIDLDDDYVLELAVQAAGQFVDTVANATSLQFIKPRAQIMPPRTDSSKDL